ncbi:MAG: hypothetical protein GY847_22175 [Proteobacteria bacterium]|nr:hypothetical protein [Pseudomonadota bacterium]
MIRLFSITITFALLGLEACWTGDELLDDCTLIGCENRLDVAISRRDGEAFPQGTYTVTFTPSGESPIQVTCSFEADRLSDCKGDTHTLELTGDDSEAEFVARIGFAPTTVIVTVELGEQRLGEQTISPDYHVAMPNGPECDPICFQATVSMEVSAPIGL